MENLFYKHIIITKKGYEFYSRVIAGDQIKFTKIEIGDGELDESINIDDLKSITNIINHRKTIDVYAVTQDYTQAVIHAKINSNDLTDPFKFREVGIYAKIKDEEILYAYLHAGEEFEYLRPTAKGQASVFNFEFAVSVGKAENVEVVFNNINIVNNSINIDMLDDTVKTYISDYVSNAIDNAISSLPVTNNKFELIKNGDNYIGSLRDGDLEQIKDDFVLNL